MRRRPIIRSSSNQEWFDHGCCASLPIVALSALASLASAQSADRELSITDIAAQMKHGELTSHALVQQYLDRIAKIDKSGPAINAIIELNPDALAIADAMDAERKRGKLRGPLHGVPVLIKDNIDTADKMHTSAGSLALANSIAVERFRRRRAVAQSRRRHPRQNQSQRVGEFPFDPIEQRLERTRRSDQKSVRARSQCVRIEFGNGCGHRRESRGGRRRHRNRWLDRLSVGDEWNRRHQADGRTDQRQRHRSDLAFAGHRRTDGAHRRRCRDSADRPRDRCDASQGLHEIARREGAARRAHRRRPQTRRFQSRRQSALRSSRRRDARGGRDRRRLSNCPTSANTTTPKTSSCNSNSSTI